MIGQLSVLTHYLYYRYFCRFQNRRKLERRQQRKIKCHLRYVAAHSSLYQNLSDLEEYPIADKEFMMEHFDQLNTVGISRKDAEAFAVQAERDRNFSPKLQGVTVGLSSGTSGKRGIFLVSDREKNRWAGYILAKFLNHGILHSYSIAFFMRADSNLYQAVSSKRIRFHFFDIYRSIEEHMGRLEEICPHILVGQPSLLLLLAEKLEQRKLNIHPQTVISIAEVLEKEDESYLKKVFSLDVIHQVYQCTEGCLAVTCSCGTLHLNEDIVHIEREYLDDCRFVPIVTDFERKAQPVIRYRLNDILVEKREKCKCGNSCLALEKIEGREDDIFTFFRADGNEVAVFPDFIRRCVLFAEETCEQNAELEKEDIQREDLKGMCSSTADLEKQSSHRRSEYRIVQEEDGNITVYSDFHETEKRQIAEEFRKLAEDKEFLIPKVTFQPYHREHGKKMKRVESFFHKNIR